MLQLCNFASKNKDVEAKLWELKCSKGATASNSPNTGTGAKAETIDSSLFVGKPLTA